ncbi:MAG: ATP-binding protein [Halobacteriovoraceae bacterium]|nr:ATP-binding protein [Halobacteriovoraceae bacterium]
MKDKNSKVIEKRLILTLTGITLIPVCLTLFFFYLSSIKNMESMLGKRLEHIANNSTILIDREDHEKILKYYISSHNQITKTDEFKRIKKVLRGIRQRNNLNSDVFTLIKQDWAPGHTLFLAMDNDKSYVGSAAPLNPLVENVFNTGTSARSLLYQNNDENWVSAFAPIKNNSGKIIAVLQLDYNASAEILETQKEFFYFTTAAILLTLLLAIPIGSLIGKSISRPIMRLASGMEKVSKGNLAIKIPNTYKWEIGLLTNYFNDTIKNINGRLRDMEHYTDDLEEKIEVTKDSQAQLMLDTILSNTKQGLFVFDKNGKCYPIYSKSCKRMLQCTPLKKYLWEVLKGDEQSYRVWLKQAFEKNDLSKPPPAYLDKKEKCFSVSYKPILNGDGKFEIVMAMMDDKTNERKLRLEIEREKLQAQALIKISRDKTRYTTSLWEITRHIIRMKKLLNLNEREKVDYNLWHRLLYLTGATAKLYSLEGLHKTAKKYVEQLIFLEENSDKFHLVAKCHEDLEKGFSRITDQSKEILGENFLDEQHAKIPREDLISFQEQIIDFELKTIFTKKILYLPISYFFCHYDEMVQNMAKEKGKKINNIGFLGDDLKVDPVYYQRLFESFIHVFFNIVEYSIEPPHIRKQRDKDKQGKIFIKFERVRKEKSDSLYIIVQDDGGGIDPESIRQNLLNTDNGEDITKQNDQEILQYIFDEKLLKKHDSYGTGMDLLAFETRKIGGNLMVQSIPQQKTTLIIKVPYLSDELTLTQNNRPRKLASC